MTESIPESVRKFVAAYVRSIAQLEALLLLRSQRDKPVSAEDVARQLYCQPEIIARQLGELESAGLLESQAGEPRQYVYRPRDAELGRTVDELETIYRERRVALTTLIYSDSTFAMRSFADAFRIRKDKN